VAAVAAAQAPTRATPPSTEGGEEEVTTHRGVAWVAAVARRWGVLLPRSEWVAAAGEARGGLHSAGSPTYLAAAPCAPPRPSRTAATAAAAAVAAGVATMERR
jgi:hypothetical protein